MSPTESVGPERKGPKMAQVKYKPESVRSARHTIKHLLEAVNSLTAKFTDNESAKAIYVSNTSALPLLYGARLSQEDQVARLTEAREWITESLKSSTALENDFEKDGTSHEKNQIAEIIDLLAKAKEHTTCARQFAKDRRFVSKHPKAEVYENYESDDAFTDADFIADDDALL